MPVKLHIAIALGLVGGLALGLAASITGSPALLWLAESVEPLGTAFVNLLKMVVLDDRDPAFLAGHVVDQHDFVGRRCPFGLCHNGTSS